MIDETTGLQAHHSSYILAVRCTEPIEVLTPTGRMRMTVAEAEARFLVAQDWLRLSMGEGTKGPRWFDWTCLPILHQCEDDGHHWMLIRRLLTDPNTKAYYVVFGLMGTTLPKMVSVIAVRWHIEEDA